MIPIEEAVELVQAEYSKGARSVDSRLSTRHIYSNLLNARTLLVQQQSNKNQTISHWAYQVLPSVPLELVTLGGCQVLRSKYKLPKVIPDLKGDLFKPVTTSNGEITFSKSKFENVKYAVGNRYTADMPLSYLREGYLIITKLRLLESVPLEGLFEDPIEVYNFNALVAECTECLNTDYNTLEFPIDRKTLDTAIDVASRRLIVLFSQMKPDIRQNSMDDNSDTGTMIHQPNYGQDQS